MKTRWAVTILGLAVALVLGWFGFARAAEIPAFPASHTGHVWQTGHTWHTGKVGNFLNVQTAIPSHSEGVFQEFPPECIKTKLTSASGTIYFAEFCGEGSLADSPFLDSAQYIGIQILDGQHLTMDCGLTRATRCVFFWQR